MTTIGALLITVVWAASGEQDTTAIEERATVRVAGIVLKWVPKDRQQNYRRAEGLIRQAAQEGAKIICTTESFLDGYSIRDKAMPWDDYFALAEPIPGGAYITRLTLLAKELGVHLIAGVLERDGLHLHNSAVIIGPDGGIIGKYRKCQLGHETARNTPGSEFPSFETPYGKVGLMICADRRFPETMAGLKKNGAEIVFCPSGGMWGPKSNDPHLQQRSREGAAPIIFVHPIEFLVTGTDGRILERSFFGDNMDEQAKTDKPARGGVVRLFDLPR